MEGKDIQLITKEIRIGDSTIEASCFPPFTDERGWHPVNGIINNDEELLLIQLREPPFSKMIPLKDVRPLGNDALTLIK